MVIEIMAKPGPSPRDLILRLHCDGDHGLFERHDTFEGGDFITLRSFATRMGWKETYAIQVRQLNDGPRAGLARLFLCPECGRKIKENVHG